MSSELPQSIWGYGKRMSTYRIYLDSRERKSGSASDFEYLLPYTLSIRERSLAMVDVVVVPNSIKTVGAKNNMIYVRETVTIGADVEVRIRYPTIPEGYYTVETLRLAIQDTLNGSDRLLPATYVVEFNEQLGRYQFSNVSANRFSDAFAIYTKESLLRGIPAFPNIQDGNGAWRLLGLEEGEPIVGNANIPIAVATAAPNLQQNTQIFLRSNLGMAAQSVGPGGNQSIVRRIIMDAPTFGLCIDKHATSWDSIEIPGSTTISSFTMSLCGFDGEPVDLNGQNWSCSISIFREG